MNAIFFRCVNFDGGLIGESVSARMIDLNYYIKNGFHGECLPIIKKTAIIEFPYEDKLRGFESIAYFRMLAAGLQFRLSDVIARKYRTENTDRLSLAKFRKKRAKEMLAGYYLLLEEYKKSGFKASFLIWLKIFYYQFFGMIRKDM